MIRHTKFLSLLILCALFGGCGSNAPHKAVNIRVIGPGEREPMFNMMDLFGDQALLDAVKECRSANAVRLKQPNYELQDQTKIEATGAIARTR